jgi:hypothetical protein
METPLPPVREAVQGLVLKPLGLIAASVVLGIYPPRGC